MLQTNQIAEISHVVVMSSIKLLIKSILVFGLELIDSGLHCWTLEVNHLHKPPWVEILCRKINLLNLKWWVNDPLQSKSKIS